jgi:hypothetical protein
MARLMRLVVGSCTLEGAMPAPHALLITVSEADRVTLQSWPGARRRPRPSPRVPHRARGAAGEDETNGEIAERLQTNRHTVAKWRGRYAGGASPC